MRAATVFALVLTSSSLAPTDALAQGGVVGSIIGSVYDQTGMPLKGVKITARSETQIGGPKVAYSNDEGIFRISALQPGEFEVTATAPKLKTVLQKGIRVGINAPAEANLILEVQTEVEEVKVVEKAPVVSTTSASVKETYDEEFLDSLPLENRATMESIVANSTAGAYQAQFFGQFRSRGGASDQNAMLVEGFRLTGHRVSLQSLAAAEIQTAGAGADHADTPGAVVNMVTKSGSNKFEVDISTAHDDSLLRFFKDETDNSLRSWHSAVNPAFSGPIVKDRLWFYLTAEILSIRNTREKDPSGLDLTGPPVPYRRLQPRGSLKLTWQVAPRHKVQSFTNVMRNHVANQQDGLTYEADAQRSIKELMWFSGITWEALLTDNVFFKSQVGTELKGRQDAPQICSENPIECEHVPQIRQLYPRPLRLGNFDFNRQTVERSVEVINAIEWYLNSSALGDHVFKVKSRFHQQSFEIAESTPGDYYLQINGTTPDRIRTYYANDPRLEPPRYGWWIRGSTALTVGHAISDRMRLTRHLTLNAGVAHTFIQAESVGEAASLKNAGFTPHASVVWDATHDGRTAVRAGFSNYVDANVLDLARFGQGSRVSQECRWNAATETFSDGCTYSGGAQNRTFGTPCGASGLNPDGSSCKEDLKLPRTWEYTAGAETELLPGVALGADLIYRLFTSPYEVRETNRLWQASGLGINGFRSGRNELIEDLGTPDNARRRYLAVTAGLRRREGRTRMVLSYTWARLEGNTNDTERNDFGTNPARDAFYSWGYLADDARHSLRGSVVYQASKWLSLGFLYRYNSGRPYSQRYRNDVEGNFTDYRAMVGNSPGANINDPGDDRQLRLPDRHDFNVNIRGNLRPLIGIDLEPFVDILNVLANRTALTAEQNDGPLFGAPLTRTEPFRLRVGFRYRYR